MKDANVKCLVCLKIVPAKAGGKPILHFGVGDPRKRQKLCPGGKL